jgi:Flagellar biosynthesis protein, FliO
MDMLQPYLYLIYIALGVIALALLLWIAMRFLGGTVRGRKGSRLAISEYYEIDKTRRLVLVRRDDVEHLVLIGGNQDVVIESEITSPLTDSGPQAMRQAPRPAVFGSRRPNLRPVEQSDMRPLRDDMEN